MDYNYKESKPLNLKTVKKVTATEQVITSIREALAHKQLKYGDKLPNETELAAKLGVDALAARGVKRLLLLEFWKSAKATEPLSSIDLQSMYLIIWALFPMQKISST